VENVALRDAAGRPLPAQPPVAAQVRLEAP
jgi:hypothetical protein